MAPGITAVPTPARILFLDAYDSFTNNIVTQARETLGADVTVIHIDDERYIGAGHDDFLELLSAFDAVIAGPGPGDPSREQDVGLLGKLWSVDEKDMLPVLGICLGYQSLALAFGASIERLPEPRHGVMTNDFLHDDRSIFKGIGEVKATQYHSLRVNIGHSIQTQNSVSYPKQLWEPTEQCPDLEPLAWDWDVPPNKAVLMATRHLHKPFWGVQYHPESICTNEEGARVVGNWWREAQGWIAENKILRLRQLELTSRVPVLAQTIQRKEEQAREGKEGDPMTSSRMMLKLDKCGDAVQSRTGPGSTFLSTRKVQGVDLLRLDALERALHQEWEKETVNTKLVPKYPSMSKLDVLKKGYEISRENSEFSQQAFGEDIMARNGTKSTMPWLRPDTVHVKTCGSGQLRVSEVCGMVRMHDPLSQAVVFESGLKPGLLPSEVGTGRYSIVGIFVPNETLRLSYSVYSRTLYWKTGQGKTYYHRRVEDIWEYLRELMDDLRPIKEPAGPRFAPFWGGLMGYASYEAGLDTIGVKPSPRQNTNPDLQFAFITRSIVIDHTMKKVYVQSIRSADDMRWVVATQESLFNRFISPNRIRPLAESYPLVPKHQLYGLGLHAVVSDISRLYPADVQVKHLHHLLLREKIKDGMCSPPLRKGYESMVESCQEEIAAGNSYELCLTQQTTFLLPPTDIQSWKNQTNPIFAPGNVPWTLFRNIMDRNPAPFGAYIRFGNCDMGSGVSIVSSSPERFMSWDRKGRTQCRPIKGTVRKGPNVTRADADEILQSSKERAENLMIVDLTRHQLHGVFGSNVTVPHLMEVEEYETVYQLVSVVEGVPPGVDHARTPEDWEEPSDYVSVKTRANTSAYGIRALAASLPPGSMTGAPKKRSCELLKEIEEDEPRGIYAGVLGYLDVGGGGDFSVVIRTAVCWEEDRVEREGKEAREVWRIGAGGAVTSQSTASGEYDEMFVKLGATLGAFTADPGHPAYPME
ncbi:ADC synthase [Lophium mytilinum]|uniref:aminodeoxychorismate synthase n=1 Tax=Lophium mytilinum TaxID=390894 RepID=A0A6A6QGV1_9PEZI|nr:ADC synthase [Lophium mytilinum]